MSDRLGIAYPVIQGPFGGGLSSVDLVRVVSDAGGLGSFGAHHLDGDGISALGDELHAATQRPFAINLWVSTHDVDEAAMTPKRYAEAAERLRPLYDELEIEAPPYPDRFSPPFEEQVQAVLEARPAAFSFVFGVPDDRVLAEFRAQGIVTLGTATTADEAAALDAANVDVIVASGADAGGHRGAFLAAAERSLVGTLSLVGVAAAEVSAPIVAAGGIADARAVAAARALGAEGVQVGTAFLATAESAATPEHRAVLRSPEARNTVLTRAFSGRLARGVPNRLVAELSESGAIAPYPYQGYLLAPVLAAARARGRTDVVSLWSGQAAPLLRHDTAAELFAALVDGTDLPPDDPPTITTGDSR